MPPERPVRPGAERPRARSIPDLFRSLSTDLSVLVRQELTLARAEIREAMRALASGAARAAAGGAVAAVGALTVLAGIVVLVGQLIGSYWLGALLVGLVLLVVGTVIAVTGARRLSAVDPTPRHARESTAETIRWARSEFAGFRAALRGGKGTRRALHASGSMPAVASPAATRAEAAPEIESSSSATADPPQATSGVAPALRFDRGRPAAPADAATAASAAPAATEREPGDPPPPREAGMVPFLKHLVREIIDDNITGQAARLAYYAFLALPPALMALFGLAGLIGSETFAAWLDEQAALALPASVHQDIIGPFIEQVVLEEAPGPFSIGLLLALWGGSAMFAGLIDTLNHAYDIEESRSFVRKRGLSLLVMLGSVLLFIGAAGSLLIAPVVVDYLGFGRAGEIAWNLAQWPVAFAFMVLAFWCAYYFLPNRDQRASKGVLVKAAAVAAALWVLATAGFRIYIANFSSYSETYGFLGAFIILLLWLFVTSLVVLVGGELASEMERRNA